MLHGKIWSRRAAIAVAAGIATASAAPPDAFTGKPAPPFALRALDGRVVKLSDFRGKVVLVNFWATWCAPCRIEMPWLAELQRQYRPRGLEVVGIAMDEGDLDRVAKFAHAMNVDYPILAKDGAVGRAYGGVRFLPHTFFVGRDGRILSHSYGIRTRGDFESDVRRALEP